MVQSQIVVCVPSQHVVDTCMVAVVVGGHHCVSVCYQRCGSSAKATALTQGMLPSSSLLAVIMTQAVASSFLVHPFVRLTPSLSVPAVPVPGFQAEETQAADVSGPLSLIATIVSGFVVGISFLLCVTFSIQDPTTVTSSPVNPVFSIAWDAVAARSVVGTVLPWMDRWFQSVARTRLNLFQKHTAFISSGCQLLPDRHGHCRQSLLQSRGMHGAVPFTVPLRCNALEGSWS